MRLALSLLLAASLACNQGSLPGPLARCLGDSPAQFWVEPVPAATEEEAVTVEVHIEGGERVNIVTEGGSWVETGAFTADQPVYVRVRLLPDTTHKLVVSGYVPESTGPAGCKRGGYTLTTTHDKHGVLLAIVQLDTK